MVPASLLVLRWMGGRKAAYSGRALWKPSGSQGYSDQVEVKTTGAAVITGLELQKPRRGEAV